MEFEKYFTGATHEEFTKDNGALLSSTVYVLDRRIEIISEYGEKYSFDGPNTNCYLIKTEEELLENSNLFDAPVILVIISDTNICDIVNIDNVRLLIVNEGANFCINKPMKNLKHLSGNIVISKNVSLPKLDPNCNVPSVIRWKEERKREKVRLVLCKTRKLGTYNVELARILLEMI